MVTTYLGNASIPLEMSRVRGVRKTLIAMIASGALIFIVSALAPDRADALNLTFNIFAIFSLDHDPALDAFGNPIFDEKVVVDQNNNPILDKDGKRQTYKEAKYSTHIDPLGVGILSLGFDLTFDPNLVRVVTDLSTLTSPLASAFGFECEFSINGNCPQPNGPNIPVGWGDPLPGSTRTFSVDNVLGRVTLAYDFSSTPITLTTETNFFGFLYESVVKAPAVPGFVYTLPADFAPFVQHPESSAQYCRTESTVTTGLQCSSAAVPEPSTWLLLGLV